MIVADTSALMAILLGEPDAAALARALRGAESVVMGAPTAFELRLSMFKRLGERSVTMVDEILARADVRIVPFEPDHVGLAFDALARFGGAPAQLNYGDCMCYAVAKALDAPLLFKGRDFAATDLRLVPVEE